MPTGRPPVVSPRLLLNYPVVQVALESAEPMVRSAAILAIHGGWSHIQPREIYAIILPRLGPALHTTSLNLLGRNGASQGPAGRGTFEDGHPRGVCAPGRRDRHGSHAGEIRGGSGGRQRLLHARGRGRQHGGHAGRSGAWNSARGRVARLSGAAGRALLLFPG